MINVDFEGMAKNLDNYLKQNVGAVAFGIMDTGSRFREIRRCKNEVWIKAFLA